MCFKMKMPKPPKPPPPPSQTEARKENMRTQVDLVRGAMASGRQATNPTGGMGVVGDASVGRKTLLGA